MNAALRAVVRAGYYYDFEVLGCHSGFHGLIAKDLFTIKAADVANTIQRGGTIIKTDRCEDFFQEKIRAECASFLSAQGINHMVVIGGDGSFRGAALLRQQGGPNVIGIPATIDNDIIGTSYAIGFDTAANTALAAIDRVRDTASSHDRCFLVEVMGRESGFLALEVGIAGGAGMILTPEFPISVKQIVNTITQQQRQKLSNIIVVAEASSHPGRSIHIAHEIKQQTNLDFRVCILGHTQRGGSPTALDRKIASQMGVLAVESLTANKSDQMTAINNGNLGLVDFPPADNLGRRLENKDMLTLNSILSR